MMKGKSFIMNTMAMVAMASAIAACGSDDVFTEADALKNANNVLGIDIPSNQDWKMSQEVTADITVNMANGEEYRVAVYSNNPILDGKGIYMTKGTIKDGSHFISSFSAPKANTYCYVGLTDKNNYTIYKYVEIVDGKLTASFGEIGTPSSSRRKSFTINNDTYETFTFPSESELTAAFPTVVPADAEEVVDLQSMLKYKTPQYNGGEIWWIYLLNGKDHNYKITKTGEATIGGGWKNEETDGTPLPFNVYVYVDGNVTIKRNGTEHMNLYILKGNVTLDSNFGECGGVISVASGATLNDTRDHIAHNGGIKLYNRGTVNATNSWHYMIGNNASIYNEGSFVSTKDLVYNAGANNTSYFYNIGDDAELTASAMELNSTCNFITCGTVTITGDTKVTQQGIVWVNNGHYTTNNLIFSAKNCTFYNYCQLHVINETRFLDGAFNMMANSYAEMNKCLFNNFIVFMHNNSGVNITGDTKWGRQGADFMGKYELQGFKAVDDNATCYVRMAGTNKIPSHVGGAFHVMGQKLTLAYGNLEFYNNYNDISQWSSFDGISFWEQTSADALKNDKDGRITWNPHNASLASIADATFEALEEGECTAKWHGGGNKKDEEGLIWSYAFEDSWYADYDMNDVVLKVKENEANSSKIDVTLCCTGASYNLTVYLNDQQIFGGQEVHTVLGGTAGMFINTGTGDKFQQRNPVTVTLDKPANFAFGTADFWILSPEKEVHVSTTGQDPHGVVIPGDWRWPKEWTSVKEAYPDFINFALHPSDPNYANWYNNPVEDKLY